MPGWIVLAVLIVFGFLSLCQFTAWDDPATLAANPRLNPPSWNNLAYYWAHSERGLYTPLTYTVWSMVASVGQDGLPNGFGSGLKPSLFHTSNVLLHALSALLVYAILRRLLQKPWPALIGAMLFALHPVQVEPVAWASGLKDVMCGMFTLAALWQYLIWIDRKKWANAMLATELFIAAMLSKPTAMVVPLLVWAVDYWILQRPLRRTLLLPAIWCMLAIPIFIITWQAQQIGVITWVEPHLRPLVAGDALTFYFRQILWPAHLIVDYTRRPATVLSYPMTKVIWLIPAALALVIVWQRRRHPWLMAAGLLFLAPLLPVLGLQPFMMQFTSTVADHYLYLPMFGVALAAAYWMSHHAKAYWYTVAATLLMALAIRSALQTRFWKGDETLNRHTLAVNPNSFTAHINLASDLKAKGDFQADLRECEAAVRCNPDFPLARANYAIMLATLDHLDEAIVQCVALQRLSGNLSAENRNQFGSGIDLVGRKLIWHQEPAKAIAMLQLAIQIDPQNPDAALDLKKAQLQLATTPPTRPPNSSVSRDPKGSASP
jgi:hypothetical protein